MNQVNLVGRIVKEPQLRKSNSGKSMMFLTLAVDGYYDKKKKEKTSDFIPVTLWGKTAEQAAKAMKGSLVQITGRLSPGRFPDKSTGEVRYVLDCVGEEIHFLAKPKGVN